MTVFKINVLDVPADSGDELAHRFAARAGEIDDTDGFEGFDLLKPTDGRNRWLVVTRWRDDEAFTAWQTSASFHRAHGGGQEHSGSGAHPPVASGAELWAFERVGGTEI